ncbi:MULTISPECIES: TetR family transcriptional regulator [Virgibacillus]|uniref:TetR family transcriptional regulator n=2 Tax=Virgibacillus TaxID=84406 RepID=A0ABQ2DT47_9BACI|nr:MULTISPECIES: TetR family transcriptional regulator [Virgibacillus]EQB39027.1 hypothetical protein M948_01365 [Virgibacillus sp. CM-4]MYL43387.1 TetR family transcriptional regulator [Virgibacillus massiliensis]GGJ68410.1 TetR family transcriptional regulator [Virgibacillus kapii]CDQ41151.1 putative HTH-type transcriptional regulator YfiR [Virgibacillus massiliensis]
MPKVSHSYKLEKRQAILAAAKKVFINKGYTHATMEDILTEAKISRGGLYSYFNHLDHIFMDVLYQEDQQILPTLDYNKSVWNQLTTWIKDQKKSIQFNRDSLILARSEFFLSTKYKMDKENASYLKKRYELMIEVIKETIQLGEANGEFNPIVSKDAIAQFIISCIDGLMLNTFQHGSAVTNTEEQIDGLLFSLKHMLCPVNTKE